MIEAEADVGAQNGRGKTSGWVPMQREAIETNVVPVGATQGIQFLVLLDHKKREIRSKGQRTGMPGALAAMDPFE